VPRETEKSTQQTNNETNPKGRNTEKPYATGVLAKRKRSIVSDTLVSKLSTLFGRSEVI
jgi:hypothetical protein